MRHLDTREMGQLPGMRLKKNDTFSFECHSGLDCFNRCCRNLNLFLYPYDVIRLKRNLKITSGQFIDQYTDVVLRDGDFFPEVLLRMDDNREKTCPFLTAEGCSVYLDRPDTCRTFPLEQGAIYDAASGKSRPVHFFRPPDFCLGQHEDRSWNISTWAQDQQATRYHRMTRRWADFRRRFQSDPWAGEGPGGKRARMAFMATYNMDSFRQFVFNSTFLERYRVKSALLKPARTDDAQLLILGLEWVEAFLWGLKGKHIRLR